MQANTYTCKINMKWNKPLMSRSQRRQQVLEPCVCMGHSLQEFIFYADGGWRVSQLSAEQGWTDLSVAPLSRGLILRYYMPGIFFWEHFAALLRTKQYWPFSEVKVGASRLVHGQVRYSAVKMLAGKPDFLVISRYPHKGRRRELIPQLSSDHGTPTSPSAPSWHTCTHFLKARKKQDICMWAWRAGSC